MDYIREFDIQLDKEYYYAGETISGNVVLDTIENFKLRRKYLKFLIFYDNHLLVFSDSCSVTWQSPRRMESNDVR